MADTYDGQNACAEDNMDTSMISIRHLCKQYPNVTPLRDINLEIKKGEVISIGNRKINPASLYQSSGDTYQR